MKVGLFFGSFNPLHVGHLVIANYVAEFSGIDQVWFMVTPQNPDKPQSTLLPDHHRYEIVFRSVTDYPRFKVSNFEFSLPKPSYTINTLTHLTEKYPNHEFSLIMGMDNLQTFHKWKNYRQILENYKLIVYPRPGYDGGDLAYDKHISVVHAPLMEISSSFIRQSIKDGRDVRFFLPQQAWEYVDEMNFYRK